MIIIWLISSHSPHPPWKPNHFFARVRREESRTCLIHVLLSNTNIMYSSVLLPNSARVQLCSTAQHSSRRPSLCLPSISNKKQRLSCRLVTPPFPRSLCLLSCYSRLIDNIHILRFPHLSKETIDRTHSKCFIFNRIRPCDPPPREGPTSNHLPRASRGKNNLSSIWYLSRCAETHTAVRNPFCHPINPTNDNKHSPPSSSAPPVGGF